VIQYRCDGCDFIGTDAVKTVGKDRHYCPQCLPHVEAFLRDLHTWLEATAKEYRAEVQRCDRELRESLPSVKRMPVVDDILLRIEDR